MLPHSAVQSFASRVAAVLMVLACSVACGKTGQPAPAPGASGPPPAGVGMITLGPKAVDNSSVFIPTLRSLRSTTVQPQGEGIVTRVFVKAGDHVRAGTPLVQIDAERQQASVRSAEASKAGTQADVEY